MSTRPTRLSPRVRWLGLVLLGCFGTASTSSSLFAQTTARWLNPAGGLWFDGSGWSTSPIVPNNGTPAGTTYGVLLDLAGPNPYTISLLQNASAPNGVTLDSVQIQSTAGRIEHLSGRLAVGSLDISSGTYVINGGTFSGLAQGTGGEFTILSEPSLDAVTLKRPMILRNLAAPRIYNGLTLNDGQISHIGNGSLRFVGGQTLAGTGTVNCSVIADNGTLTIAPGILARSGFGGDGTIVNQGHFLLDTGQFVNLGRAAPTSSRAFNDGTITIDNGTRVEMSGSVKNRSGVIRVNNGTLIYGNSGPIGSGLEWRIDQLGQLEIAPTATVVVSGTWQNAGMTFRPERFGNNVEFSPALHGGTLDAFNAGPNFRVRALDATDVTVVGKIPVTSVAPNSGALYTVRGSGTLADATLALSGPNAALSLQNGAALRGTGIITLDAPANTPFNGVFVGGTQNAVFGPGITLRAIGLGNVRFSGSANAPTVLQDRYIAAAGTSEFVNIRNEGTVLALGGTVQFDPSTQHAGTLEASTGGVIEFRNGAFATGSLGLIQNTGGEYRFNSATFNPGAATINLADSFGTIAFANTHVFGSGTITGQGTVNAAGSVLFSGVRMTPEVFVSSGAAVATVDETAVLRPNRIVMRNGILNVRASDGVLEQTQRVEFLPRPGGPGSTPTQDNRIDNLIGTLAVGSQTLVTTAGGSGSLFGNTVVNYGTIAAVDSATEIRLGSRGFLYNFGHIHATNGATVTLGEVSVFNPSSALIVNNGTIHVDGGTVNFGGTFSTSTLGTIHRGATSPGTVNIAGSMDNLGFEINTRSTFGDGPLGLINRGHIVGGRIVSDPAVPLRVGNGKISSATLSGAIEVLEQLDIGSSLYMSNATIRLNTLTRPSILLSFSPSSIDGTGTITSVGENGGLQLGSGLLLNSGIHVIADAAGGTASFLRLFGRLTVSAPGRTFGFINRATNDGTIQVTNGGRILSTGTMTNNAAGRIIVDPNSVFRYNGATFNNAGVVNIAGGAMVFDYPSAAQSLAANVRGQLTSGYAAGSWNGLGISSTLAANDPERMLAVGYADASDLFSQFPATFMGESVDNTSVLVRLTLYGDADLNGTVNISDFARLAPNFNQSMQRWSTGDFDYNGFVNINDFTLLAMSFNRAAPTYAARSSVPEPVQLGSIFACVCWMYRRRIRRR